MPHSLPHCSHAVYQSVLMCPVKIDSTVQTCLVLHNAIGKMLNICSNSCILTFNRTYTADLPNSGHALIDAGQTELNWTGKILRLLSTLQISISPSSIVGKVSLIFRWNALSFIERGTIIFLTAVPVKDKQFFNLSKYKYHKCQRFYT